MNCPVCGGAVTVIDTARDCESIYRRRKCKTCDHVFYTTESELKTSDRDFHVQNAERRRACGKDKLL